MTTVARQPTSRRRPADWSLTSQDCNGNRGSVPPTTDHGGGLTDDVRRGSAETERCLEQNDSVPRTDSPDSASSAHCRTIPSSSTSTLPTNHSDGVMDDARRSSAETQESSDPCNDDCGVVACTDSTSAYHRTLPSSASSSSPTAAAASTTTADHSDTRMTDGDDVRRGSVEADACTIEACPDLLEYASSHHRSLPSTSLPSKAAAASTTAHSDGLMTADRDNVRWGSAEAERCAEQCDNDRAVAGTDSPSAHHHHRTLSSTSLSSSAAAASAAAAAVDTPCSWARLVCGEAARRRTSLRSRTVGRRPSRIPVPVRVGALGRSHSAGMLRPARADTPSDHHQLTRPSVRCDSALDWNPSPPRFD